MTRDKRPTILDVAAKAGVSKSTVSLVLQDSDLVKKETRETVERAMRALNYVRNRAAVTLRGSGTGLIGLVINDLRNPFFTEFAASAQMTLAEHGFATVIANCDEDAAQQDRTLRTMLEHDVAGLMISPSYGGPEDGLRVVEAAGVPALQVLRRVETSAAPLPFFTFDYANGCRLATQHLLDKGLKRIAFVGGTQGRQITEDRMTGYANAMAERGLTPLPLHGRPSRAFGREMARQIMTERPDLQGAVCFNDLVALGMLSGLAEAGRRPGEDFAVIGFDDIEEARLSFPALTTVRCNVSQFGRLAAEHLMQRITDPSSRLEDRTLPVELVVRGSDALTAATDH